MARAFSAVEITPRTWQISGVGAYSFLVAGNRQALLIDTGMSSKNIREYAQSLTNVPLTAAVNTHGHADHTGGNRFFDRVYMTELATADVAIPLFRLQRPKPIAYAIETVSCGHRFDLGERTLEVIALGAHSPGSLFLLDARERLLFTGDEIDPGQVLLIPLGQMPVHTQTVQRHLGNMRVIWERSAEFDRLCPAHNGTLPDKSLIRAFIELDKRILAGEAGSRRITSKTWPFPGGKYARRLEHNGASLCYDLRRIRND